jgi:hypothetical protein
MVCQERLRLSWKVEECKPLRTGALELLKNSQLTLTVRADSDLPSVVGEAGAYTRPLLSPT